MKERRIETPSQLSQACADIAGFTPHLPFVITITEGKKIRTDGQNKRHWVEIEHFMGEINEAIDRISESTGYTPAEVKVLATSYMPPEHMGILYARTKKAVHDELKAICNIPTSTRLGTKAFSKFDEILEMTIAQIVGEINSIEREAT